MVYDPFNPTINYGSPFGPPSAYGYDPFTVETFEFDVPSTQGSAPPAQPGRFGRMRQQAGDAFNQGKQWAGDAWTGVNRGVGDAGGAAMRGTKALWNAGPVGKAIVGAGALGATALGTRFVAYPLLSGTGVIGEEQQDEIARSSLGRALTGEEYDPSRAGRVASDKLDLQAQEYIDLQKQAALEEQQRFNQEYEDRARFNSDMAYQNAVKFNTLGLGLGTTAKFRDVYAKQLQDSTDNYLKNVELGNQALHYILNPQVKLI